MNEAECVHVTLVRHGESESNLSKRWQGQGDSPLSPRGRAQAARVGARLSNRGFDRVLSSDLSRAADTAAATGFSVEQDATFRELDVGRWEGLTREEVDARFPEEIARLKRGEDLPLGGGESYAQFVQRVDAALRRVCAGMNAGERLLVVCHGGVIAAAVSTALGVRGRGAWPTSKVVNTSISELDWSEGGARVRVFNDDLHLPGELAEHDEDGLWHGVALGAAAPELEHLRGFLGSYAHRYDLGDAAARPEWLAPLPYAATEAAGLRGWLDHVAARHPGAPAACTASAADLRDWIGRTLELPEDRLSPPLQGSCARLRGGERPVLRLYNADPRR